MRILAWLVSSFLATIVLTTIMAASQGLHLTRMSLPYLLGSAVRHDRDQARIWGFVIHLFNGFLFGLGYLAVFHAYGSSSLWFGALLGLLHALFVLTVGMTLVPAIHPRMASEKEGPTLARRLEPPGFFARNYGRRTALSVIVAHLMYGALLATLYNLG